MRKSRKRLSEEKREAIKLIKASKDFSLACLTENGILMRSENERSFDLILKTFVNDGIDMWEGVKLLVDTLFVKKNRLLQIKKEAIRRTEIWLKNSSFEEMSAGGSLAQFNMSLGLLGGYNFELEPWMKEEDFGSFVTKKEFNEDYCKSILSSIFAAAMKGEAFKEDILFI